MLRFWDVFFWRQRKLMAKAPSIGEQEFLKLTRNHGEFCDKLTKLDLATASDEIRQNAHHVGLCWLRLAIEHIEDAKFALASNRDRIVYSRSYYAAYSASKSIRYIVNGIVSLAGDDHGKAPDLPGDFVDVAKWAVSITKLYEHRLRADYDNWGSTKDENSLSPAQSVEEAEAFLKKAAQYLETKYGIKL
jgi:uncharacterized protein (UPF0332 family)